MLEADHGPLIAAAYGLCALILGGLCLAIALEHRRLKRALARLGADRNGRDESSA